MSFKTTLRYKMKKKHYHHHTAANFEEHMEHLGTSHNSCESHDSRNRKDASRPIGDENGPKCLNEKP